MTRVACQAARQTQHGRGGRAAVGELADVSQCAWPQSLQVARGAGGFGSFTGGARPHDLSQPGTSPGTPATLPSLTGGGAPEEHRHEAGPLQLGLVTVRSQVLQQHLHQQHEQPQQHPINTADAAAAAATAAERMPPPPPRPMRVSAQAPPQQAPLGKHLAASAPSAHAPSAPHQAAPAAASLPLDDLPADALSAGEHCGGPVRRRPSLVALCAAENSWGPAAHKLALATGDLQPHAPGLPATPLHGFASLPSQSSQRHDTEAAAARVLAEQQATAAGDAAFQLVRFHCLTSRRCWSNCSVKIALRLMNSPERLFCC